jgi:arylsulfatase A-like enzyme
MKESYLLITIDGVRKDRLGIYNYRNNNLTPNINKISSESLVFDNLCSAATSTGMCFSSIFTGRYQYEFKKKFFGDSTNPFADNIFKYYEDKKFNTYVFLNERFKPHHKLINSFSKAKHFWTGAENLDKNKGSLNPLDQAKHLDNILSLERSNFFSWIHLWGFSSPSNIFLQNNSFDYDARVNELDNAIGYLFEKYKHICQIFIFSDHGYSLLEKNKWSYGADGSNLSEEVISVPFLIYDGENKGRNKNLVSQKDIINLIKFPKKRIQYNSIYALTETRYEDQPDKSLSLRYKNFKLIKDFNNKYFFYDLNNDHNENINYFSNKFFKLTRDENGNHPNKKPYIIRNDYKKILQISNRMKRKVDSIYSDSFLNKLRFLKWKLNNIIR